MKLKKLFLKLTLLLTLPFFFQTTSFAKDVKKEDYSFSPNMQGLKFEPIAKAKINSATCLTHVKLAGSNYTQPVACDCQSVKNANDCVANQTFALSPLEKSAKNQHSIIPAKKGSGSEAKMNYINEDPKEPKSF